MRLGWQEIWDPAEVNVIDIAAVTNTHYMHQSTLNFIAHTGETLKALGADVTPQTTWTTGEITATQDALTAAFPTDIDWGPGGRDRRSAPRHAR